MLHFLNLKTRRALINPAINPQTGYVIAAISNQLLKSIKFIFEKDLKPLRTHNAIKFESNPEIISPEYNFHPLFA